MPAIANQTVVSCQIDLENVATFPDSDSVLFYFEPSNNTILLNLVELESLRLVARQGSLTFQAWCADVADSLSLGTATDLKAYLAELAHQMDVVGLISIDSRED